MADPSDGDGRQSFGGIRPATSLAGLMRPAGGRWLGEACKLPSRNTTYSHLPLKPHIEASWL